MPAAAIAAAAWSWVEKMLQDDQRTSAPSAVSVSISAAVWMVMCKQPAMRAPFSGCDLPNSLRSAMRPGISVSAMFNSLRPQSARLISRTLKSWVFLSGAAAIEGEEPKEITGEQAIEICRESAEWEPDDGFDDSAG